MRQSGLGDMLNGVQCQVAQLQDSTAKPSQRVQTRLTGTLTHPMLTYGGTIMMRSILM